MASNYHYMKWVFSMFLTCLLVQGCYSQNNQKKDMDQHKKNDNPNYSRTDTGKIVMKDEDWKRVLSPEVYYIARQKGTERPWSSKFENLKEAGTYYCAACGNPLFKSDTKFDFEKAKEAEKNYNQQKKSE